jgi:hypothetical protein
MATAKKKRAEREEEVQVTQRHERAVSNDQERKIRKLESAVTELRSMIDDKDSALSKVKDELAAQEKKIALFIDADPEIEKKGEKLLVRRAEELAEKRKKEEIQAQKKRALVVGERKIDALLDEMTRG